MTRPERLYAKLSIHERTAMSIYTDLFVGSDIDFQTMADFGNEITPGYFFIPQGIKQNPQQFLSIIKHDLDTYIVEHKLIMPLVRLLKAETKEERRAYIAQIQ